MPVMTGALAVIVNPLIRIPSLPSVLVTTTLRGPEGAAVRSKALVIWFWFTTTMPVAGISGYDELFNLTVADGLKPVPAEIRNSNGGIRDSGVRGNPGNRQSRVVDVKTI